jgi:hypothetical protein
MNLRSLLIVVFPFLFTSGAGELEFFEAKIRPILAEKCYECHSARSGKMKGGLRLDHINLILSGGDSGPALRVGKPHDSLLVEAVHYQDPDFHMPPKGKLPLNSITDLEKWITDGAFWPNEPVPSTSTKTERSSFNLEKRKDEHWCWQAIRKPVPPIIAQQIHGPIDSFIRSRLMKAGLTPANPSDKRTWLRRVTYDLTGLPPSLDETNAFISDSSTDSYEIVVERLLSSSHYGEKWARHWMDLVRYAETCGHEFDYPLENPHEYRDYLIRAFNLDVPYNQFLREHIAGDLLKEPRRHPSEKFNESIIGTGFWYFHEAVHAPTDSKVDNADRMENQLDVFGKTFLGLTIGCARCHDHKFDAISEKDYYSLAAFMQGSTRQEYPLDVRGEREEISGQLLSLAKEGFLSVEGFDFNSGKPSDYWNVSSKLMEPKKVSPTDENPWNGEVLGDFENDFGEWKPAGKAFGTGPQTKTSGRNPVTKYHGKGWAGSLVTGGDNLTGSLFSPEFIITKRFMNFLIAGGAIEKVGVELWIEESRKIISRGSNNEIFTPKSWDISGYLGNKAQIRLIDNATGGWGHIHADRFVQSNTPAAELIESPVPSDVLITRVSAENKLSKKTLLSWCQHFGKRPNLPSLLQSIKSAKNSYNGLVKAEQNFIKNSQSFANFTSSEIPKGWKITGEAFKPRGHQVISFDGSNLFPNRSVLSSNTLGNRRVGNLRSPHFKIEHDQILVRAKAKKVFMRVVIDNYHMGKHSGLLFGGTVIKEANSEGEFKWFSLSPKKYKGHWAYLEFVDRGTDAFLEIDQVRFANSGMGRSSDSKFSLLLSDNKIEASNFPKFLDNFLGKSFDKINTGKFSGEEYAFLNYLYSEGLIPFENQQTIPELLRQAEVIDSTTPRERYTLTMGRGSPFQGNVYVRGSPHNLGEPVHGRNLTALGGQAGSRLDLADQLISENNPLVSRVMANRIWLQFFGRGIVPTPDDFGPMGQEPSHPELLDWLANDFRENNWSIKSLVRKIVLSKTYRQSSTLHPSCDKEKVSLSDPQNILLHKMPVRRLQAEAIRDSILSFSGRIDKKLFGPSVPIYKTAFMTGRGGKKNGPLDGAGRRSIYGSVYRNFLSPFMLAFDQPAPFGTKGKRSVSNVPAQSLALMNDPFVIGQCKMMGKNIFQAKKPKIESVGNLFEMITGKPPSQKAQEKLLAFLEIQSKAHGNLTEQVWADLAHVLINSKGFLFLN